MLLIIIFQLGDTFIYISASVPETLDSICLSARVNDYIDDMTVETLF